MHAERHLSLSTRPRLQRGAVAMITVLFLLIVVGFTVLVSLNMSGSDVSDSTSQHNSVQALFLAESAIERAGFNYGNSGTCTNAGIGAGATAYSLGSGSFTLDSAAPDAVNPALCRVRVTGRVGQIARTVDGWFSSGGGSIALEAVRSAGTTASVSTFTVTALTVGGSGRVLVVGITVDTASGSAVNRVRYAGQDLTFRVGAGSPNRPRSEIWTLANPPAGTGNVVVNLTGSDQIDVGAMSFTGVDTLTATSHLDVTPVASPDNNNDNSASVMITPVTNNAWLVDTVSVNNGNAINMTAMATRLRRWYFAPGSSVTGAGSTLGPVSPAAARTLSWSWSGNERWTQVAIALRPGGSPELVRWSEVVQ